MALTTSPSSFPSLRRNPAAPWRHVDVVLLGSVLAIATLGVMMVYSATHAKQEAAGLDPHVFLERQLLWVLLGVGVMVAAAVVDYRVFRDFAPVVYLWAVGALLVVLSPLGSTARGSQSWFALGPFQLQPSELAKLALIVAVAAYCAAQRGELDSARLVTVLAIAAAPMALIVLQPDFGTALVFVAVLMAVLLVAGARPQHIAVLTLLGVVGAVGVFQLGVLRQYQVDRLTAFLDQSGDTQRTAYNQNQSQIAIGAGGLTGKGFGDGTQTNLDFVPEQHTDFIFTVVGEELGFVGSVTLLALFAIVVWRTWRTAHLAKDFFGTLVCVGVVAMFVFQVFENMGMTMGIMPVTGIPLPFVSYGGSSTLTSFAAIGLVLNVHMRRFS